MATMIKEFEQPWLQWLKNLQLDTTAASFDLQPKNWQENNPALTVANILCEERTGCRN